MVLDVFSKYGWITPLKDKKAKLYLKHSKLSLKKVGTQNTYGLTKERSITTNMWKTC